MIVIQKNILKTQFEIQPYNVQIVIHLKAVSYFYLIIHLYRIHYYGVNLESRFIVRSRDIPLSFRYLQSVATVAL